MLPSQTSARCDPPDSCDTGKAVEFGQLGIADHRCAAGLASIVHRWFDLFGAAALSRSCKLLCDGFEQGTAIGLDRQGVVAASFQYRRCKPTPTVQRIGRNDAAFEVEKLQCLQGPFR